MDLDFSPKVRLPVEFFPQILETFWKIRNYSMMKFRFNGPKIKKKWGYTNVVNTIEWIEHRLVNRSISWNASHFSESISITFDSPFSLCQNVCVSIRNDFVWKRNIFSLLPLLEDHDFIDQFDVPPKTRGRMSIDLYIAII